MAQISTVRYAVENNTEASKIARDIVQNATELRRQMESLYYVRKPRAEMITGYRKMAANALQYFVNERSNMPQPDVKQHCIALIEGLNILWNLD